jgi:hypothetical protein
MEDDLEQFLVDHALLPAPPSLKINAPITKEEPSIEFSKWRGFQVTNCNTCINYSSCWAIIAKLAITLSLAGCYYFLLSAATLFAFKRKPTYRNHCRIF